MRKKFYGSNFMSNIEILAGVIHELKKDAHTSGENSTELVLRDSLHDENILLRQFVEKIDQDSRKSSRATSRSARFTENDTFSKIVLDHLKSDSEYTLNKTDFLDISITLVEAFKKHMQDTSSATGGYVPVLWYKRNEQEFLLIGVVNPTGGFTINTDGDIIQNTNIDEEALRFSVSIELGGFISHAQNTTNDKISNYIRWTTKRNNEISHYFQQFIPTEITIDDGKATNNFINYCKKYLEHIVPKETSDRSKVIDICQQEMYRYLLEKGNCGQSVDIDEDMVPMLQNFILSHPVIFENPAEVIEFSTFCEEQGLDDYKSIFHPRVTTLKRLINVSILVNDSIIIKGELEKMIESTQLVVNHSDSSDFTYAITIRLTKAEYDTIKSENPSISSKDLSD